ncbi:MAG: hypothetical protein L6R48_05100 [Planctomycetes bacterium]|nr:hypothetical protein [Planctomycetota bacterium]
MMRRASTASTVLLALVALAAVAALIWTTWSHWRERGQVRVQPWEGQWWTPVAEPVDQAASSVAGQAARTGDAIWGPQGVVGQAEAWTQAREKRLMAEAEDPAATQAPVPAPQAVPAAPATPAWVGNRVPKPPPGAPVRQIEAELVRAETAFRSGLDHYRQADPAVGAAPAERQDHLRQAVACFAQADNLLAQAVPAYAAADGALPRRLEDVRALQAYNRRLFEAAREAEANAAGWR